MSDPVGKAFAEVVHMELSVLKELVQKERQKYEAHPNNRWTGDQGALVALTDVELLIDKRLHQMAVKMQ